MPIDKPSEKEEEYFARKEIAKLRQQAEEEQSKMEVEEREQLRDLHRMRCPKCGMQLGPVHYLGVEIDTCSSCSGIWLDAGELEKLQSKAEGTFFGGIRRIFGGESD
jgi:hypothetical protein